MKTSIIFKGKEVINPIARFVLKWLAALVATFVMILAVLVVCLLPIWMLIDIPLKMLGFKGIVRYTK